MAKVQRVPRSLLALCGIVGENPPQQLSDTYAPILDVSGLIIAELEVEGETGVDAAAVGGSEVSLTVPGGEVWFLEGVNGLVAAVAAGVSNIVSVGIGAQAYGILHAVSGVTVPAIIRSDQTFAVFSPPYVLTAGQSVTARLIATDAGGNQTLIVTARFRRIRV